MELIYTINDLDKVVKSLLNHCNSKFILFYGTMGVGKTTLIKALAKTLGSPDEVQSPTYAIVNEYKSAAGSIYHFDLYRINDLEELYNIGFEDYLNDDSWIFIEWPQLVANILPKDALHVYLEINEDKTRKININKP